jgi:hypothetical protein
MTTKILMYYFLVERAVSWVLGGVYAVGLIGVQYIIRGSRAPRFKTKLWLFNCLGMLCRTHPPSATSERVPC